MATKEQRKLQKRKERDKENRQSILKKREATRAVARVQVDDLRREKRIKKLQRDLDRYDHIMSNQQLETASDETLTQIEKNIEILKALESEHMHEIETKQKINDELEKSGHYTLEEKMQAARELFAKDADMGVGGSAECKVSVNKVPKKETADVSVIKAPEVIIENS